MPRELTAHRVNGCNEKLVVTVEDEPGHGGACHAYKVLVPDFAYPGRTSSPTAFLVCFQNGPIAEVGTNGVTHEAILAILIDRLQCFQRGDYACRENALALTKLEEAMMWLQKRTRDRLERGVEGTHAK